VLGNRIVDFVSGNGIIILECDLANDVGRLMGVLSTGGGIIGLTTLIVDDFSCDTESGIGDFANCTGGSDFITGICDFTTSICDFVSGTETAEIEVLVTGICDFTSGTETIGFTNGIGIDGGINGVDDLIRGAGIDDEIISDIIGNYIFHNKLIK